MPESGEQFEQLFFAVSSFLVPTGWPIFVVLSIVLGVIGIPLLQHLTEDGSGASRELREGGFGLCLIAGILSWILWALASCVAWGFSDATGMHLLLVALSGLGYGICFFSMTSFAVTAGSVVRRFAVAPENYPGIVDDSPPAPERHPLSDSQRRDNARALCERLFWQYAGELGERFTRDDFEQYVKKFLSDDDPAELVETRASEFQSFLQSQVEEEIPESKPITLDELQDWYDREQSRVTCLELDERMEQSLLATLHKRYHELLADLYEGAGP